jgi:flagellar biosynthetic protein FliR
MQELLSRLGVDVNVNFSFIFLTLIWVRVLAMSATIPFLFGKPVPNHVKVGLSIVLALYAYPHLVPATPPELSSNLLFIILLYLKEAFYGFCLGFAVSILFHAFQSVGQMIDNQRGVSIARILIPQLGQQGSISGLFLFQLALVLYLSLGGHLVFLDAFYMSFKQLPVLAFPTAGPGMLSLIDLLASMSGMIFSVALQLAGPVIIAILMADIILGLANRISPQINVWELGFNVKGYTGILLLAISITMISGQIVRYTEMANQGVSKAVYYLEGHKNPDLEEEAPHEDGLPKELEGPPPVISQ